MSGLHPITTVERIASAEDGAIAIGPFGSAMKADLYVPSGVPVVRGTNIGPGRSITGDFVFIAEETAQRLKRSLLKPGDLFFPHRGAIGEVGIIRESWPTLPIMSSSLMRLRVDSRLADSEFVFWYFKSDAGRHEILQYASTVGTPGIGQPLTSLRAMQLPLPPLPEQREIAAILGALDDKIEVNRKTSALLEEMARALYRSWFVTFDPVTAAAESRPPAHIPPEVAALFPASFQDDGLPEGWRMGTLGEVARNARQGADPAAIDPETPYIGLEHIPRRSIAIDAWGVAEDVGSTKSLMRRGQFLFGKLRPYFHKVGLVPIDGICSTDILVVEAKSDPWREFVLSVISSVELVDHVNAASTGTRMPRAKWQDLADYQVTLPPLDVAKAFSHQVRPMHARILSMIEENKSLAALRDSLLPRLMSGELRVGEARERVEEVAL